MTLRTLPRSALLLLLAAILAIPAMAAQVIDASGPPLALETHQGRLVRLARPAANVFIADPEIADVQVKSPQMVYLFGKKAGQTSFYAVDSEERVIAGMPVVVSHNIERLRRSLGAAVPGADIGIESVEGNLMLTGMVDSPADAEEARRIAASFVAENASVISRLRITAPTQVNLRVRVAEVKREVVKQFGFNWDALLSVGDFSFGVAQGAATTGVGGAFPSDPLVTRTNNVNNLVGTIRANNFDLNALVDALEKEGFLTVLAQPNLTAMSGETASFLAGGEFPIPVPQNNDTITITYKKFGVSLVFTPTLLGDGRINLAVAPEVSQLTSAGSVVLSGFTIPALATRRAETTIELGSGQSFAVAGLLQSTVDQDISKFPGLGDLPVLGSLFRSDTFRRGETELVIIVTPYLVRPVTAHRMMLPTEGMVPPNDAERIFGRKGWIDMGGQPTNPAHAPYAAPAPVPSGQRRLVGPMGFVLE